MGSIDLGQEDGFVTVTFGGAEIRLDLFGVNDRINAAIRGEDDDANHIAIVAVMKDLGLPEASRRVAVRFINGVRRAVEDCKKKPPETADSPGSTTSTPAP